MTQILNTAIIPPDFRALIIDDSAATRRILRTQLESLNIEVAEADDGKKALAFMEENIDSLGIVISDIEMPVLNGYELCHRYQQAPWYDGTPLVFISTVSDSPSVIRALKLGADDFIPKPFDREMLLKVIGRVIDNG